MRCNEEIGRWREVAVLKRTAELKEPRHRGGASRLETIVAWVGAVLLLVLLGLNLVLGEQVEAQPAKPRGDALSGARVLDEFRTAAGAQVRVYELPDRSVVFSGEGPARTVPAPRPAANLAELYRQLVPGRAPSAALGEVLARPLPALKPAPQRAGQDGAVKQLAGAKGGGMTPKDDGQQWFRNQYCSNTSGTAYNWCLTGFSGNGWAYSNNVWYGTGTACALTGAPTLTVRYVGSWTVPAGTCHWATHSVSGGLFNPDPRFNFRMDITGNGGTYDFSGWTLR